MEALAFYSLFGTSAALAITGLRRPTGYMEFPTLAAVVFVIWVIPQLAAIRVRYQDFYSSDLVALHLFCLVCLLSIHAGWLMGTSYASRSSVRSKLDETNLTPIAIFITFISTLMAILLNRLASEADLMSYQWSGPITIIYFFSNLKVISLFLSVYLFLKKRKKPIFILLLLVNILIYFPTLFIYFRRRAFFEFFSCLALAYWFATGRIVPRVIFLSLIPVGMLFVFAVGELRRMGRRLGEFPTLDEIMKIDFVSMLPGNRQAAASEMNNAFVLIKYVNETSGFTYGADSWNRLVFQWIPGQIVGHDFKRALMFETGVLERALYSVSQLQVYGSTSSAMGDAYMEFGFFGFIFFMVTAAVVGNWWVRALHGDLLAILLYGAGLSASVLMITAYPIYFFNTMLLYGGAIAVLTAMLRIIRGQRQVVPAWHGNRSY